MVSLNAFFAGVKTPICGITGSQKLVKTGWLELRNLSNAEPPFRLLRDDGKTYLQVSILTFQL